MKIRQILLSTEISKYRALTFAGLQPSQVLLGLRKRLYELPKKGVIRSSPKVVEWGTHLCGVIEETLSLGSPVGALLQAAYPIVRREERNFTKLKAIEKQYSFQAAISLVIPWLVVALNQGLQWNFLTGLGILFQLVGLFFYLFYLHKLIYRQNLENDLLIELLMSVWLRLLAGLSLYKAFEVSIQKFLSMHSNYERRLFFKSWQSWLESQNSFTREALFEWPKSFGISNHFSLLFSPLFISGAPAKEIFSNLLEQLEDERQSEFEFLISEAPTRISLLFCFFLAPASFLIFGGSLWPELSSLDL